MREEKSSLHQKGEKMVDFITTYHITVWTWNGEEDEPVIVYESEDLEKVRKRFESMTPDIDHPQIDLWEIGEDEDVKLDSKDSYLGEEKI